MNHYVYLPLKLCVGALTPSVAVTPRGLVSKKRHQSFLYSPPSKKGQVEIEQEGSCLQDRKRAVTRNRPGWHLDIGLLPSRTRRKVNFLCLSHSAFSILLRQPEQTNPRVSNCCEDVHVCVHYLYYLEYSLHLSTKVINRFSCFLWDISTHLRLIYIL